MRRLIAIIAVLGGCAGCASPHAAEPTANDAVMSSLGALSVLNQDGPAIANVELPAVATQSRIIPCADVARIAELPIPFLKKPPLSAPGLACFIQQPDGDPRASFDVTTRVLDWEVGVVYVPKGMSVTKNSIRDICDGGGVLLTELENIPGVDAAGSSGPAAGTILNSVASPAPTPRATNIINNGSIASLSHLPILRTAGDATAAPLPMSIQRLTATQTQAVWNETDALGRSVQIYVGGDLTPAALYVDVESLKIQQPN